MIAFLQKGVNVFGGTMEKNSMTKGNDSARFGAIMLDWDLKSAGFNASEYFSHFVMSRSKPQMLLEDFAKHCGVHPDDFSALDNYVKKAFTINVDEGLMLRLQMVNEVFCWTKLFVRVFF